MKTQVRIVNADGEKPTVDPRYVELRIPFDTARIVKAALGKVNGTPDGPRGHTSEVYEALDAAGVGRESYREPMDLYFGGGLTGQPAMPNGQPTVADVRKAKSGG